MQIAYDPDDYAGGAKEAQAERRLKAKAMRDEGRRTYMFALPGQQRGYSGLGSERDLTCRTVYMLDITE